MYINDLHILYYVLAGILAIIIGSFINWCNIRMPEEKKVFSKEIFSKNRRPKPNYIIIIVMVISYVAVLYFCGLNKDIYKDLDLIKFGILIPMLLSAFAIDYKHQIIPNRLNLTMFEAGLLLTFMYGIVNINIAINMLLGMVVGAGIFLLITLLGRANCWKRSNGIWRCKTNGSIRAIFWT